MNAEQLAAYAKLNEAIDAFADAFRDDEGKREL